MTPFKFDPSESGLRKTLREYHELALRFVWEVGEEGANSGAVWRAVSERLGEGYVDTLEGTWRTTCPQGCQTDEGNPRSLRPILHIPFDEALYHEFNVERYELSKSGKILFNHPQGTHDDRFWAVVLAVYASEQAESTPSRPIARII